MVLSPFNIEFDSMAFTAAKAQQLPVTPWSLIEVVCPYFLRSYDDGTEVAFFRVEGREAEEPSKSIFLPFSSTYE